MVPISNAEAKYDADSRTWQYFSTAKEDKGKYIVSVKQNKEGEYEFYNFAEKVLPPLHPEIFVKSTWAQMARRMRETGAVKALFCDIGKVSSLEVIRYTASNVPAGLMFDFREYPVVISHPYLKEAQANPEILAMGVYLDGVNSDMMDPISIASYDQSNSRRTMDPDEILVGQYGKIVNLGDGILKIKSRRVLLLGGYIETDENRMLLDSFAKDEHGRLMHP